MTLDEIKEYVLELGRKIELNDDSELYPMFSDNSNVFSEGDSIFIENSKYYYVIMERGRINKIYESEDIEEILYPLFESITFHLALKYELNHRIMNKDPRRIIWKHQLELLEKVNKKFSLKCQDEIDKILKIAPFNDNI